MQVWECGGFGGVRSGVFLSFLWPLFSSAWWRGEVTGDPHLLLGPIFPQTAHTEMENYSAHIQCHCFHCSKHLRHFSFQTQGHSNKHPILAPVLDLYFTKCTCTGQSFRRNWIGFVLNTKVASKIGTVLKYFIMFKTFHNGRGSS